jgi:Do/DeqQ family serine protease
MNCRSTMTLHLIALFLVLTGAPLPATAGVPLLRNEAGVPTLAPVLEQVTPAVVNISVLSQTPRMENPLFRDPFFRRFFNLPERAPRPQISAGSGVIVDASKGLVLTNHHVIDKAEAITITLKDRRHFRARLLGSDPATDIALLEIDADGLSAVKLGDSDDLRVGDFVVAVGNPFGLGQTVTSGIVSALGRSGLGIEGYEDFIQTDASINPGNSGGALINLSGELVGINTAIIGPSGGNVGIGFAVPSNMASAIATQLAAHGKVRRGQLGISAQDLTPELAEALDVDLTRGAVITEVEPGSTANRAGIQAGDVIVSVDGRAVRGSADLRNQIGLVPAGKEVELKLVRDGRVRRTPVPVGIPTPDAGIGNPSVPQLAGATFRDYGKDGVKGVLVVEMERGGPAWQNGLRPGDIIVAVNRRRVHNVGELVAAARSAGRVLALNALRGNARVFIVIQ